MGVTDVVRALALVVGALLPIVSERFSGGRLSIWEHRV